MLKTFVNLLLPVVVKWNCAAVGAAFFLTTSFLNAWGVALFAQEGSGAIEQQVDFVRDVRPILSDKCFHCHGPDAATRETELRFDSEISAKSDLGGYAAVVPGQPDESELVARIESADEFDVMPPADSHLALTENEKLIFRVLLCLHRKVREL